ncbi:MULTISPECIES: hypothetical protein [unclassified Flavobacterium]|uniref:hypothetical protein n=1 Tax=unclassified Flavobacterium TaxID=196869 RepID=UPI003618553E
MKTDLYTKTVLSIIAVCLTILTLQSIDIIPKSYASEGHKNLSIVPNRNYGLVPLNENGTIDVNITSSSAELDVNLRRINTNDELDVNIDEIGGGFISHGGPIPVTIK